MAESEKGAPQQPAPRPNTPASADPGAIRTEPETKGQDPGALRTERIDMGEGGRKEIVRIITDTKAPKK